MAGWGERAGRVQQQRRQGRKHSVTRASKERQREEGVRLLEPPQRTLIAGPLGVARPAHRFLHSIRTPLCTALHAATPTHADTHTAHTPAAMSKKAAASHAASSGARAPAAAASAASSAAAASSSHSAAASSAATSTALAESRRRTYDEEMKYIRRLDATQFEISLGFVPGMRVPGRFYVNKTLEDMMFEELKCAQGSAAGVGGFLPAVKQIANVSSLPGIVGASIGLPDVHSGYGFAIGNVAAFDMDDPESIVSPGGVGFDINCGVRLIRTNLHERDVRPVQEKLTQSLFDHIPVGVGSKGVIPTRAADLVEALEMGMDWSLREGYAWSEDKVSERQPGAPAIRSAAVYGEWRGA